jgi:hypothetical protein
MHPRAAKDFADTQIGLELRRVLFIHCGLSHHSDNNGLKANVPAALRKILKVQGLDVNRQQILLGLPACPDHCIAGQIGGAAGIGNESMQVELSFCPAVVVKSPIHIVALDKTFAKNHPAQSLLRVVAQFIGSS